VLSDERNLHRGAEIGDRAGGQFTVTATVLLD
jgi:hypothetical protein